ncbi:ATP-dependent helicase [Paraliomyxa miuraensis]|uniref:ATP-dependent helicase n=1 Tax=Paraliomyxa miuraensis TaxID=376150 RepID=UPI0022523059|nr:ATP-dependent helicase [Paraliomyxa miuraensis]MCX4239790.1 ATP-dependent helicase [Paraliomyxa miuraensis]
MKYVLKTSAPARVPFDARTDLNPQQRAVVEAPPGPLLVIAGAGTGKTRTLTYRVARLVAGGCPPERILLCTFTNRAAREMTERVEALLQIDMRRCFAGTFHHIGNRILRRHAEHLGLGADFGILDPEDARTLLAGVIAELGLKTLSARRFPAPKELMSVAGLARGTGKPVADVIAARLPRMMDQVSVIEDVLRRYDERKRSMNLCDFDDLLARWHELLVRPEHVAVAQELRAAFDHVLVDEYQDINALQGALCDAMAAGRGSLTAVGDDAQSIYAFRGADFEQIAGFCQRHPQAQLLRLTINYRSTPEILALANRCIAHNRRQHPKELSAVKQPGMVPAVIPLRDVYQQAELVAQRVLELHHEQGLPLRKMAVLYRNHGHSLELQVELSRRQIPFRVRSGVKFFEQAHIKDVVAYLRARQNPRDGLSWVRLLRQWPGVGAQTAERIAGRLSEPPTVDLAISTVAVLEQAAKDSRGRGREALGKLARLWSELEDDGLPRPGDALRRIVQVHYGEYADRTFSNGPTRREDLEHLAGYADRYPTAQAFLDEVALVQGVAAENVVAGADVDDALVLSTIHQAKGLEWPVCLLLWLADGRFPSAQALRSDDEIEEERRLFYVAVTRAADELYLCYPTLEEARDGPMRLLRPSRFLREVDDMPPVFSRWEIEEAPADEAPEGPP